MRRILFLSVVIAISAAALPSLSSASHSGAGGARHDFASGSGANQFAIVVGEARLSVGAQSDPGGIDPRGHVRAQGDPDGDGPMERFKLAGEVTCLRVEGDRAAIKYRFEQAEGSAEPFEGGGVQVFLDDNGEPRGGEAVDGTAFDPPQPAGVFQTNETQCDDPSSRAYDQIESGNFVVHDAP